DRIGRPRILHAYAWGLWRTLRSTCRSRIETCSCLCSGCTLLGARLFLVGILGAEPRFMISHTAIMRSPHWIRDGSRTDKADKLRGAGISISTHSAMSLPGRYCSWTKIIQAGNTKIRQAVVDLSQHRFSQQPVVRLWLISYPLAYATSATTFLTVKGRISCFV